MDESYRKAAVINCWVNENSNMVVEAVAGSGKTTLLLDLVRRATKRTLFLAFNKSIQVEIEGFLTTNNLAQGKAMTLHALGLMAIRGHYRKVLIDNSKNYKLSRAVQDANRGIMRAMSWKEQLRTTYTLMDMNDVSRMFLTNDLREIKEHMVSMDKMFFDHEQLITLWDDLLLIREQYFRPGKTLVVDFIDMIFITVDKGLTIPINPAYLFIDEAQDLNIAQHKMIENFINQGTIERWVAVGDRNQAIYGFAGAYGSSFDIFNEKFNTRSFPLDICYRCPVDVISAANEVYDVMSPHKTHTGVVATISDVGRIKDNSMVICRNTAPLVDLYFSLLGEYKKPVMKGEDIIGKIITFLKPYKKKRVGVVVIESIRRLEDLSLMDQDDSSVRYEHFVLENNLKSLMSLLKAKVVDEVNYVETLIDRIETIFSEPGNITLCTIHKSKGLEAKVVYILNEDLIPSKYAKSPSQLAQEKNLKYVARTRASEEMYYLNI